MRFQINRRTFSAVASAVLFSLSALNPVHAETPKDGGTLVIGTTQNPRHLNGAVQSGLATAMPSTQLFASPLRFDDQWKPHPYLAESWDLASDGKSLTLHLRKDAVFHDGKPVTSEDVAFSIMAIKANHPFKTMMGPVETVETPDAHTAIIRMSTAHPAILLAMSPALCPILPKHIYGDGSDLKKHARNSKDVVGSGPFKLAEFVPGQRVVLERFDRFFLKGKPHLDKIVFNINSDTSSLVLGLERGDIQMLPAVSGSIDLRRLSKNANIALTDKGYEGVGAQNWLAFNTAKAPLNDKRVRQAIAHAIDKNFITKVLMAGFAKPAVGPIVVSSPFAEPNVVQYKYDLAKTAALLDEAGFKPNGSGERMTLTIDYIPNLDEQHKNVAEYIRAQLKKVGVTVQLRASADFPSWAKRIAAHDFDLTMDSVWNWGDPVIGVHRTYLSTNIRPVIWTNTQSYSNPEVDKLLNSAGATLDPTLRKAYYSTFQKIIAQDVPIQFINGIPMHTAASKKVGNLPTSIWGPMSPMDDVFLR